MVEFAQFGDGGVVFSCDLAERVAFFDGVVLFRGGGLGRGGGAGGGHHFAGGSVEDGDVFARQVLVGLAHHFAIDDIVAIDGARGIGERVFEKPVIRLVQVEDLCELGVGSFQTTW